MYQHRGFRVIDNYMITYTQEKKGLVLCTMIKELY